MKDTIYRADAIEAFPKITLADIGFATKAEYRAEAIENINALPSAEAEPTVIRSRSLMPTKDFREWAKRIREDNPNVIVIPCDAEVASAEDEDRLYIKIYADDEPSVMAEKLYQICGEQNRETAEWLKEYFPSAEAVQGWIPCSERLPKVNQRVLLATNDGWVFVGYREKPDLVWQVTEKDGRKHWVYDPENYTDDIEILPKNEDCGFSKDDVYSDGFLSVASVNYDDRFVGVTAWMPLPKPYKGDDDE